MIISKQNTSKFLEDYSSAVYGTDRRQKVLFLSPSQDWENDKMYQQQKPACLRDNANPRTNAATSFDFLSLTN